MRQAPEKVEALTPHHFVFLLASGYMSMTLTTAQETLRIANRMCGRTMFRMSVVSEDGQPVPDRMGVEYPICQPLFDVSSRDTIVVCAGADPQKVATPELINWIRRSARNGCEFIGLASGAWLIAEAGLLNEKYATIHWEYRAAFEEVFPNVTLSDETYIQDGKISTTAGGTTAIDIMLQKIAKLAGNDVADLVADQLLYTNIRTLQNAMRLELADRTGIRHPKIAVALELMEANLEEPLQLSEITEKVGVSSRHLERLFLKQLQTTPKKYYVGLRLQRALHLLLQTDMSVTEVTTACGFSSASHFSKLFRHRFRMTPSSVGGR